jgi:hypothetical protein
MPSWNWTVNPIFDSYALVAVAAVALIALALFGMRTSRTTPGRRWTLLGLRLATVLLVILAMLRPTHVYTEYKKQPATLIVLLDHSRSMLVADAVGGKSRWDALKAAVQDALPVLDEIKQDIDIKVYEFDADARALELKDGKLDLTAPPAGEQTAIGAVLDDVVRQEADQHVIGVLLLSDGAQQSQAPRDLPPQTSARQMAQLKDPLYTLVFGQALAAEQARDIALTDLAADQTVFIKNELPITATARVDGYAGQDVPVQLLFENTQGQMEVVGTTKLHTDQDGGQVKLEMSHVPQAQGEFKLTLRAAPQPGELVTTNNDLSTFVTVRGGGVNVFYLEGERRVEQRFLRRALDSSPNIKVDYELLDQHDPKARGIDLSARFQKGKYDVYILGDIDSSVFRKEDLELLRQAVENGAGLLALGGFHSFWPGGYQATPLADVLPLRATDADRLVRQTIDGRISSDLHWPGPLKMRPAQPFGVGHPLMTLAAPTERNRAAWEALPPLDGANKFNNLKPTAKILADTPDGRPLLVADEVGGGRVLIFAGDSTWHWAMKGFESQFKKFWQQAILWLARKTPEGSIWVQLDRRRFSPNARVDFTVGAQSPEGEPVSGAAFTAEIIPPGGAKRPARLTRQGESVTGTFVETQDAGDYAIVVKAAKDGSPLGEARARFLVHEQDLELNNAAARPQLLASLANITSASGGRPFESPDDMVAWLRQLKDRKPELQKEFETKETPWDKWPFLLALVALLGGEWYLRKRWGLV